MGRTGCKVHPSRGSRNGRGRNWTPDRLDSWDVRSFHTTLEPDEMSRQKSRGRPVAAPASPFDQARDEMFQHVMRCGVIGSEPEHQKEWFDETMNYLAERYHELSKKQIGELRVLGERFAAPTMKSQAASAPELVAEPDEAAAGELDTVSAA
jgi:hypothetical protein